MNTISPIRQVMSAPPARKPVWAAALAGLAIAISVIALWREIDDKAHEHVDASTRQAAHLMRLLIAQDVDHRFSALDRLAQRWIAGGGSTREVWEADATRYVLDMPGFASIDRLDATMQEHWSVRDANTALLHDPDISRFDEVRDAVASAYAVGETTISDAFGLGEAGTCIAVILPVSHDDRNDGVLAGVLQLRPWLDVVLGGVQTADHHVRILLQGREVYRSDPDNESLDESDSEHLIFATRGLDWEIKVVPASRFLSAGHADSSTLVLIVGLMLSALVSMVVYLALVARARSRQFQDAALRFEALIQNLPGMAYRRANDPGKTVKFVSEGCSAITGYPRQDLNDGRISWDDLIHAEDRRRVAKEVSLAIKETTAFEVEYRITDRHGNERWVWDRGRLVYSEFDDSSHVEGIVSDITDRKLIEFGLLEARAFSEAVVETAADAVITINSGWQIEQFNRASRDMFGYPLGEIRGDDFGILLAEPFRTEYQHRMTDQGGSQAICDSATGREVVAQRKDGTRFPIDLSISQVPAGPERRFVALIRDISEQRAAEDEARQHREHLAHVDRLTMLGEMATGIAHEINQPLTAISLFVQAGKRMTESGMEERLGEIFEKLMLHAHRASAVIERTQNMARRRECEKTIIGCDDLLQGAARLAEAEARIRDIAIDVRLDAGLPAVEVDPVQIQQVVLNLLRNAMESMQSFDAAEHQAIGLHAELDSNGWIEVSVIDRGTGVSEETAPILFAPFSTTKKSGMGMGLSISRAIITAHGGKLDFRNNRSGGATFFFTLPPADDRAANE
jgi:two-component system sensor kinase FixL